MDKLELEIIISALFLILFMGFFFNSGASGYITGRASITGATTYNGVPTDLKIIINNNDYSTDKSEVVLNLHASGARECRYKNSGVSYWSNWSPYTNKRAWMLTSGLGEKSVSYECRNDNGYSSVVSDFVFVVS